MPRYELLIPETPDRPAINPFTKQPIVIKGRPEERRFWEIEMAGSVLRYCAGSAGAYAFRWTRKHASEAVARDAYEAAIAARVESGYKHTGKAVELHEPEPAPDRAAALLAPWEERIRHAPEDDAAYIECATALGGARAEIARLYEKGEPSKRTSARPHVHPAEQEIIKKHEKELLGPLAKWTETDDERTLDISWRFGFACTARIADGAWHANGPPLPDVLQSALNDPVCRFVRELTIGLNRSLGGAEYGAVIAAIAAAQPPVLESVHVGTSPSLTRWRSPRRSSAIAARSGRFVLFAASSFRAAGSCSTSSTHPCSSRSSSAPAV